MILVRHGQSEWNVPFGAFRIDAGIPDPDLTEIGRAQAQQAAETLADHKLNRLVASPYRRTLATASIIGDILGLDIEVEPLVRERCAFSCDQGSSPTELAERWPNIDFSGLGEIWWGGGIESALAIQRRRQEFYDKSRLWADRNHVAVISHWGFIRAATGRMVENAEIVHWPLDEAVAINL